MSVSFRILILISVEGHLYVARIPRWSSVVPRSFCVWQDMLILIVEMMDELKKWAITSSKYFKKLMQRNQTWVKISFYHVTYRQWILNLQKTSYFPCAVLSHLHLLWKNCKQFLKSCVKNTSLHIFVHLCNSIRCSFIRTFRSFFKVT